MKKVIALLFSAVFITGISTGCGGNSNSNTSSGDTVKLSDTSSGLTSPGTANPGQPTDTMGKGIDTLRRDSTHP